jgi:uncharacterized protein with GYD domain
MLTSSSIKRLPYVAAPERRLKMATYLIRARWSSEAFKGLLANPHNRSEPIKQLFSSAGATMQSLYWSPTTGEMIGIGEGDINAIAAAVMVVNGPGQMAEVTALELVPVDSMAKAAEKAQSLMAKYRPPSA